MDACPDYEDLFKTLNAFRIKYLVVGSQAYIHYTEPRYTKDIDVWIIPDLNDVTKVYAALAKFGAPLRGMTPQDFADSNIMLQIGVPPVRVDIMISVPGLDFKTAWKNRQRTIYGNTPIHVLGIEDVIRSKKAAARPQDKVDLIELKNRMSRRK